MRSSASVSTQDWRIKNVSAFLARLGFNHGKTAKIGGRINPELLELAKKRSGIEADSALIELALANLVIDDDFPDAFRAARGKVDPKINLEF